jgi:undecaprenyl diphosphate synthase
MSGSQNGAFEFSILPEHIGIILDGNGRWAKARNMPRTRGHREGLEAAKRIVLAASEFRVPFLSLYVFSTENWKRTNDEVTFLMSLIKKHLKSEYNFYRENGIRVIHSGNITGLPDDVQEEIRTVTRDTADFTGLTVNLCINYGGQDEIIRAVNRHMEKHPGESVTKESLDSFLDNPAVPPADYIIRTGGELRISNFLLWESAYAELYFSDKYWPDWDSEDLKDALQAFQERNRRFGGYDK